MRIRILAALGALACLLSSASVARGTDVKRIGGDWCMGQTGTDTGFSLYTSSGVLFSGSAATRTYVCPILRDNVGNTNGLSGAVVYFTAPAGVTAAITVCSMNLYSSVLECSQKQQTGGGDSSLTWDSNDVDVSEANNSYYFVRVEFSGGSAGELIAIEWTEP